MRKFALLALAVCPAAFLGGCATTGGPTVVSERQAGVAVKSGNQKMVEKLTCTQHSNIKVAVGDVTCKAAACKQTGSKTSGLFQLFQLAGVPSFEGIGEGLQDMFTTALQQTNCFRILSKEAMKNMQEFGIKVKNQKPDYIVTAAVTSINFKRSGGSLGGGYIPIIGAISQTKQDASMAMDVQLINTHTGEVIFTKTYTAKSGKTSYGVGGFGAGNGIGFGGSLSGLSGTAMEEVARDIIIRASYDIAKRLAPANTIQIQDVPVK